MKKKHRDDTKNIPIEALKELYKLGFDDGCSETTNFYMKSNFKKIGVNKAIKKIKEKPMKKNVSIFLGRLFPTQTDLMRHLSEYGMLTDNQIIDRASQGYGLDTEEALTLTLERNFCKGVINNIIDKLSKLK